MVESGLDLQRPERNGAYPTLPILLHGVKKTMRLVPVATLYSTFRSEFFSNDTHITVTIGVSQRKNKIMLKLCLKLRHHIQHPRANKVVTILNITNTSKTIRYKKGKVNAKLTLNQK